MCSEIVLQIAPFPLTCLIAIEYGNASLLFTNELVCCAKESGKMLHSAEVLEFGLPKVFKWFFFRRNLSKHPGK
ncbi:hypothetical protein WT71_08320 [Burkholderia stagnalis]|nr:hypothetical protein WT71_08320 [Burkholderia stagnalis]KWI79294.1 hypothetical protein WT73_31075 [Burkholderia stagnalis]